MYVSTKDLYVNVAWMQHTIGEGDVPEGIRGVQNNTTGKVYIKLNYGDGVFKLKRGETRIFDEPLEGTIEIRAKNAGHVCLLV